MRMITIVCDGNPVHQYFDDIVPRIGEKVFIGFFKMKSHNQTTDTDVHRELVVNSSYENLKGKAYEVLDVAHNFIQVVGEKSHRTVGIIVNVEEWSQEGPDNEETPP